MTWAADLPPKPTTSPDSAEPPVIRPQPPETSEM